MDSHAYAGYTIPPYYDSLIGKLITSGATRASAVARMSRALGEYMITNIKTTIPFQQEIMRNADFQRGNYHTGIRGRDARLTLHSGPMNRRLFDHIDLRVSDIAAARPLYDAFLPALGFTRQQQDGPTWHYGIAGDKRGHPVHRVERGTRLPRVARRRFAVLGGHGGRGQPRGRNRAAGDGRRDKPSRDRNIARDYTPGVLRGVFRGPRRQQMGNLLPHRAGGLRNRGPAGI